MTLLIPSRSPERSKWHFVTGTVVLTLGWSLTMIVVRWYLI
ncbi:MAG: hypothetical protein ACTHM6_00760 [Tepidisphaeraceae bacterium]